MTDKIGGTGNKKRKLPDSDSSASASASAGGKEAMGETIRNGDMARDAGNHQQIVGVDDSKSVVTTHSVVAKNVISYVEFYSGVGGWTMALEQALDTLGPLLSSIRTNNANNNVNGSANTMPNNHRYELKRLAALDHSDLCVKVFSHNFVRADETKTNTETDSKRNNKQLRNRQRRKGKQQTNGDSKSFSIERMPLRQLEEWSADVWVMSPPCQPHTRQHNNTNASGSTGSQQQQRKKDLDDPRSKSFLKICQWLEGVAPSDGNSENSSSSRLSDDSLPSLIFLENVVGFESSNSFWIWQSALKSRGYLVGHFHLTPTQVRLPNDRPRFYSVAIRMVGTVGGADSLFSSPSSTPAAAPKIPSLPSAQSLLSYLRKETNEDEVVAPKIWKAIPELNVDVTPEEIIIINDNEDNETKKRIAPIASFLDCNNSVVPPPDVNTGDKLQVPEKVLKNQSAWCFDIVCPSDKRSSCFTHSYGRFIRGTGSILYDENEDELEEGDNADTANTNRIRLLPPDQRQFQADWMDHLDTSKLRYFSGMELARLFGFSKDFSFPSDASLKQQWKLMGNSLNVKVASKLIELGFLLRYYYCVDEFETKNNSSSTTHNEEKS